MPFAQKIIPIAKASHGDDWTLALCLEAVAIPLNQSAWFSKLSKNEKPAPKGNGLNYVLPWPLAKFIKRLQATK